MYAHWIPVKLLPDGAPVADVSDRSFISMPALLAAVLLVVVAFILADALYAYFARRRGEATQRRGWLSWLIYLGFMGLVAVLGVTGFGSIVSVGFMSGDALLVHVVAAGAFTFLLVAIAWLFLPRPARAGGSFQYEHRWWLARWSAWLLVFSCLAAAATMFLSMLPILDTVGLSQVVELHRYAGLAAIAAALLHAYALTATRLSLR